MTTHVCIVGDPVSHSLSPPMHNAAFQHLGMDWHYGAIRVAEREFSGKLRSLAGEGYAGVNVTIPHKLLALELADSATEAATAIRAANTLTFKAGVIHADNTDAGGFLDALAGAGLSDIGRVKAVLLGAGGTGRAAAWALLSGGVRQLVLWNRSGKRARSLASDLAEHLDASPLEVVDDASGHISSCDILVNTTSIGLEEQGADEQELASLRVRPEDIGEGKTVVDFVYRKGGTALARAASSAGATAIDGIDILVRQGARSFELWTERSAPQSVMREAVEYEVY